MANYRWLDLVPHPKSQLGELERVRFGYLLDPDLWAFKFEIHGKIAELALPPVHEIKPGHELWKQTCFELFVGTDSHLYRELNFAPDGHYAAYDFESYRSDQRSVKNRVLADVESWRDDERYCIDIELTDDARPYAAHHLGPAVIIVDQQERQSWWALEHAHADAPDFHHPPSWHIPIS